jgi:hypothetical protein
VKERKERKREKERERKRERKYALVACRKLQTFVNNLVPKDRFGYFGVRAHSSGTKMKENVLEPRDPLLSASASGQIVIFGPVMMTTMMMVVVMMVVTVSRWKAYFNRP